MSTGESHAASDRQPAFDTRELRNAFGKYPTGVTVVTTREEGGTPRGFTANSFTSVSLQPPLLLVCIAKNAYSLDIFQSADGFAVNVLSEGQQGVSNLFASKREDKFQQVEWSDGPAGHPLIAASAAWFDCTREQCVDAGDHVILIGRVVGFAQSDDNPLGYVQGGYFSLGLSQDALDAAVNAARPRVGAIIEHRGRILLLPDEQTGGLRLPSGDRLGPAGAPRSLTGALQRLGVEAHVEFLFSVFEAQHGGTQFIYYRAHAESERCDAGRFVPFDEIDWDALPDASVSRMLQRYVAERRGDAFGIYVGDDRSGDVRPYGML